MKSVAKFIIYKYHENICNISINILKIPHRFQFTELTVSVYKPQIVSVMRFFFHFINWRRPSAAASQPRREAPKHQNRPDGTRCIRTPGASGRVCVGVCVCELDMRYRHVTLFITLH